MTKLAVPTLPADHPMNQLGPEAMRDSAQFAAKLDFKERCAVLALLRANFSVALISAAFNINRRTVTHIRNGFRGYRRILEEEKMLGPEDFQRKYLTETVAERVRTAMAKPEALQTYTTYDAGSGDRQGVPSKRATTAAGITVIMPAGAEYSHRIEVAWVEANTAEDANGVFEHPAGWFWRDLDGEDQFWNGDPEAQTHFTSAKSLAHARSTLNG